jgi:hypothetical protein
MGKTKSGITFKEILAVSQPRPGVIENYLRFKIAGDDKAAKRVSDISKMTKKELDIATSRICELVRSE